MNIFKSLFDRVIGSPITTTAAIAPFLVAVGAKLGFSLDAGLVGQVLAGVYAVILILTKDNNPNPK